MIKVFNEDDYNIEKDGLIKNVDGSFMFIPYMEGINDVVYNKFVSNRSALRGATEPGFSN